MAWVVWSARLLSEMALFLAVTLGGAALANGTTSLVVAVGALALAVCIWGTWIAPRARRRLDDPLRLLVELTMFAWGGAGFVVSGRPLFGALLVIAGALAAVAVRWVGEPVPTADSVPRRPTR